jgi:transposase
LHLEVRKFFCRNTNCLRKIFTERVPDLLQPSARMTNRLRSALQALGLATGGEVGTRLAPKLGMQAAPTTLLRYQRAVFSSPTPKVRVVGLDDWAYKRGDTYGTILVDLERHQVIDLLPDRSSATVKVWLQGHPEIEVISRDRASSYADAARQGAPQATQVADRFHLSKNVREKLKDLLDANALACLSWRGVRSHRLPPCVRLRRKKGRWVRRRCTRTRRARLLYTEPFSISWRKAVPLAR